MATNSQFPSPYKQSHKRNNVSTSTISVPEATSPTCSKLPSNLSSFIKSLKGSFNDLILHKLEADPQKEMIPPNLKDTMNDQEKSLYVVNVNKPEHICKFCHSSDATAPNSLIESCECEESDRFAHSDCIKKHLEKRIFQEINVKMDLDGLKQSPIENNFQNCCFQCDKCGFEFRIKVESSHNFQRLVKFYKTESPTKLLKDLGIFVYFLLMVLCNLLGLLYSLLESERSVAALYLGISLIVFFCGLAVSFTNLYEKMEEVSWEFGKSEAKGFYPLRDYLIKVEKKKKITENA